jgi:hypothetical protein
MKLKFKSEKQLKKLLKANLGVIAIDEDGDVYSYHEDSGEWFFNGMPLFDAAQYMIDSERNTFNILVEKKNHG